MPRLLLPLITSLFLIAPATMLETAEHEFHTNTVNPVIGDTSFELKFGTKPDVNTSEEIQIKTHLNYVITLLEETSSDHLNQNQLQNRNHIVNLLKGYVEAGQFPKNHHFKNRRPVFIDQDGNLCAVGYLIAETEGLETAQKINSDHKFDYIKDIDGELIDGWLAKNGLTKTEAAMIQPAYGWQERSRSSVSNNNNIESEYAIGSSLLAGAQIGISAFSLLNRGNMPSQSASAFSASLGLASLTLGIINVDNSRSETYTICSVVSECWNQKVTYKNQSRTNLSIANIIIGGASAAYNGIQFFKAQKEEKPSGFNVSATQVFDPSSGQTAPALSFSYSF